MFCLEDNDVEILEEEVEKDDDERLTLFFAALEETFLACARVATLVVVDAFM